MGLSIDIDKNAIAEFCRKNHITKFALFCSVFTERFGDDSDVDVLVEFDHAHIATLFDIAGMEEELSALFNRTVDMRTPNDLSRHFRDEVVRTALVQYAA